MLHPVIPLAVSADVQFLCRELVPGGAPISLPMAPVQHAQALECFETVERQVLAQGGEACCGWALWEWPHLFLEAEFHCVWRDPQGKLHEITPKPVAIERVLFLPDPARRFEGRRVNNVRRALNGNPDVAAYLQACDEEWNLLNAGERAALRNFTLAEAEALRLGEIRMRKASFSDRMLAALLRNGLPTVAVLLSGVAADILV